MMLNLHYIIIIFVSMILLTCIYHFFIPQREGFNIGSAITKALKKPFDNIIKELKKPFDQLKKPFADIMKSINEIITNIKCAIKLLLNFPQCALYYLLDIFAYVSYLPFALLFWAAGAGKIEKQIWKFIYSIDTFFYKQIGMHVFHWTNSTMNKCYRCKNKTINEKKAIQKISNNFKQNIETIENKSDSSESSTVFAAILTVVILMVSAYFITILLYPKIYPEINPKINLEINPEINTKINPEINTKINRFSLPDLSKINIFGNSNFGNSNLFLESFFR